MPTFDCKQYKHPNEHVCQFVGDDEKQNTDDEKHRQVYRIDADVSNQTLVITLLGDIEETPMHNGTVRKNYIPTNPTYPWNPTAPVLCAASSDALHDGVRSPGQSKCESWSVTTDRDSNEQRTEWVELPFSKFEAKGNDYSAIVGGIEWKWTGISACEYAMDKYCGYTRKGSEDCRNCRTQSYKNELDDAGCKESDFDTFCKPQPMRHLLDLLRRRIG